MVHPLQPVKQRLLQSLLVLGGDDKVQVWGKSDVGKRDGREKKVGEKRGWMRT